MMNKEITDLQSRLAFQEDTIEQLSLNLSQQQNQINSLEVAIKHLLTQVRSLTPSEGEEGGHEMPPHY